MPSSCLLSVIVMPETPISQSVWHTEQSSQFLQRPSRVLSDSTMSRNGMQCSV